MRALLLTLAFIGSAHAADPWERTDKTLAAVALTATVIDWAQTRYIAKHPDQFYERNLILGKHPSVSRVNNYFIAAGVAGYLLADYLPSRQRKTFLAIVSVLEISVAARNRSIGIRMEF